LPETDSKRGQFLLRHKDKARRDATADGGDADQSNFNKAIVPTELADQKKRKKVVSFL
jgi:hypothetical protein